MHGPRTAKRTLRPLVLALGALALGALALGCYVVGLPYVNTCDLAAEIPFVAGGACVAGAVTLGFLATYRACCRKPGPVGWIAIVVVSLWMTTVTEVVALLASLPAFSC